ncbi:MAG: hypothetical protein NTV21_10945 [Planctomycetota bacterium]|nr:hypothetical protein [Planctomycetota bacterium]
MERRTKLGVAITVGVIGVMAVFTWNQIRVDEQRFDAYMRNAPFDDSPLRSDPADMAWLSERDVSTLEINPEFRAASTYLESIVDCRRPAAERRAFHHEASADVKLRADGSSTLRIASGDGYWFLNFEIQLKPKLQRGDALTVRFMETSCTSFEETSEVHGWVALSAPPTTLGQTIHFEFETSVSPNRCYRGEGSAKVEPATN